MESQWYDGEISHWIQPFMSHFLDNFVGPTNNNLHKKTYQQTLLALSNANNFKLPSNFRCVSPKRKNRCKSFFSRQIFNLLFFSIKNKTKPKKPTRKKNLYQNIHKWLDEKGRVYVHTYHDTSLYIKSKLQFLKKKWWHQGKHEKNGEQSKILSAVKFITRAQIEMRHFSLSCAFSWVWRLSSRCRIIFIESILKWANIKTHIHYTYVRNRHTCTELVVALFSAIR